MNRTQRVLLMVFGGLVGGYFGYWLGHWAGWSTNAEWPFRIGGGTGAILMSMGLAVVGVLLVGVGLIVPSTVVDRRLSEHGVVGAAVVVACHDLGFQMVGRRRARRQYRIVVEVTRPDGSIRVAHAIQWLTDAEAATLRPDRRLAVRYEPADPRRVLVDTHTDLVASRS